MEGIRIYTISLGCPKNLVDTESMLGRLGRAYLPAQDLSEAHVVLINTCAFIEPAVEESVQEILTVAQDIQGLRPRPLLVVTGCLVVRYGRELACGLPEVDLWLSLDEQGQWAERLVQASRAQLQHPSQRVLSTGPGWAYLKISEGCDHACSFCIIPKLRGRLKSRPMQALVQEASWLAAQGVQELILVAQDVTDYGRDQGLSLESLLDGLTAVPGISWIRLLYLYPAGVRPELLSFLRSCPPNVLPYFDVPLQHSHPEVLRAMRRSSSYEPQRMVDKIRDALPQAALRTSLIVGFPGETQRQFEHLLDFVRQVRFHNLGVFPYYAEQGTPAAERTGQVSKQSKEARRDQVMAEQARISKEVLAGYQGRTMQVHVERRDPHWPTLYQGRVWFQAPEIDGLTYISGLEIEPGQLVWAEIEETKTYDLVALAPGGDDQK